MHLSFALSRLFGTPSSINFPHLLEGGSLNRSPGFSLQPSILAYILELPSAMYFYRAALPGPPSSFRVYQSHATPPFSFPLSSSISPLSHICKPLISLWLLYIPHSPYRDVEVDSLHSSIVSFSRAPVILSYSSLYSTYYPLTHIVLQLSHPFSYSSFISSVPHSHHLSSRTLIQSSHILSQSLHKLSALSILLPFFYSSSFLLQHPILFSTSASVPTFFRRRINSASVRRAYPSSIPSTTTRRFPIANRVLYY